MMTRKIIRIVHAAAILLAAPSGLFVAGQSLAQTTSSQKGAAAISHAIGPFDVKLTPQDDKTEPTLGRMTIDKQYHGDLEGSGKGQMLTAATEIKGSGVYVAVERFAGTLKGRSGSFSLHHTGVMTRGTPNLTITVVPDSGTGQLAGIAGRMNITIAADGKHSYDLEYTLPTQ
jgi:hypothetical protein